MQISTDLAKRIVEQRQGSWGRDMIMSMADGSTTKVPSINIEEVRIGSHTLHNLSASVSDSGELIMAFPVVNSIGTFKIDTRNRKLVFESQEAAR